MYSPLGGLHAERGATVTIVQLAGVIEFATVPRIIAGWQCHLLVAVRSNYFLNSTVCSPYFPINRWNALLFIPERRAASETFPPVSDRICDRYRGSNSSMSCRLAARKDSSVGLTAPWTDCRMVTGRSSGVIWLNSVNDTARSTTFISSRTFPGQLYFSRIIMAAFDIFTSLPFFSAKWRRKCCARVAMSER